MDNISNTFFIDALELGIKNLEEGISYTETIAFLKTKGWNIIDSTSFRRWFYDSFHCPEYYTHLDRSDLGDIIAAKVSQINKEFDSCKSTITGEAYFKYLDFVEVKKAFENAESSKKTATLALIVTIIVGIAQIIVSKI
jgi:hypothetical protein